MLFLLFSFLNLVLTNLLNNDNGCSKNLGSSWDDLGKAMEGADEIEIGQVDCGTDKPVCSKVDIHSYPTFKLFYEGEEVARYRGNLNFSPLFSC